MSKLNSDLLPEENAGSKFAKPVNCRTENFLVFRLAGFRFDSREVLELFETPEL